MAEPFRILVVDDEATQRELVCGYLKKQGFEIVAASSAEQALALLRDAPVELILTDQRMPNLSGLDLLKQARAINPETGVIVMTAYGNIETAVAAMQAGAADYLTKPLHLEELLHKIRRIREQRRLYEENRELREALQERHRIEGVIGESGQMLEVISLVRRVAASEATVLIRGESGTGK
jgi:two-component system NtrC family response regulator